MKKRSPLELPKLGLGMANLLAQSGEVARAFGPWRGFVLMVLAISVRAVVGVAAIFIWLTLRPMGL